MRWEAVLVVEPVEKALSGEAGRPRAAQREESGEQTRTYEEYVVFFVGPEKL